MSVDWLESEHGTSLRDNQIDYSDIPELTQEELGEFVRAPRSPLRARTVTLHVDDEVFTWLQGAAETEAFGINLLLRSEAQRTAVVRKTAGQRPKRTSVVGKAS